MEAEDGNGLLEYDLGAQSAVEIPNDIGEGNMSKLTTGEGSIPDKDSALTLEVQRVTGVYIPSNPIYKIPSLIPIKSPTVWLSDASLVETIHCLSYAGLPREIDVPKGGLKITVSPFTLDHEVVLLQMGLGEHMRSKGVNEDEKIFTSDGLTCILRGKSLAIIASEELQSNDMAKLAAIESSAAALGAKNVLIITPDTSLVTAVDRLTEQGFKKVPGEFSDNASGQLSHIMNKKCKITSDERIVFTDMGVDVDDSSAPRIIDWFNVMIRDEDGVAQGGVTGHINKTAKIPHAEVELFFTNENVRGTGLGKMVMEKLEDYVKDMGVREIRLCTFEFQAPGFYKKIGYKEISVIPELIDGYNSYDFTKKLNVAEVAETQNHTQPNLTAKDKKSFLETGAALNEALSTTTVARGAPLPSSTKGGHCR